MSADGSPGTASAPLNERVEQHYARPDIGRAILEALRQSGKDTERLAPEDLTAVDEFHIRGRHATLELARAAGVNAAKTVLDVGSGIGGPSRTLAREFGCHVVGIDLTQEYCRVATMLAARVGLSDLVSYRQGDALELPFPDASFDIVWTQHVSMNVPDKAKLYREMYRVLKPGGALAIYDVLAGPSGPVLFPVPWARSADTSFLVTPEELRAQLAASGFAIERWEDATDEARAWFARFATKIEQGGPPPLGLHLLLGPEFKTMARNQRRNLDEGRIALVQVVAKKP
jgi:SAM-dependent methyltransferase